MNDDHVWIEAERAYKRVRHEPTPMLQISPGPLYGYCCPTCSENGTNLVEYSTTSSLRTCYGGHEFL